MKKDFRTIVSLPEDIHLGKNDAARVRSGYGVCVVSVDDEGNHVLDVLEDEDELVDYIFDVGYGRILAVFIGGAPVSYRVEKTISMDRMRDGAPLYPKTPPFGDPEIDMPAVEAETREMVLTESILQAEERIAELEDEVARLKELIPPYSGKDYAAALDKGLDLDDWDDYQRYYGLGESPREE